MASKTAQEIEAIASAVEVGDVIPWQSITGADPSVRVMAIAEGYAMVRRTQEHEWTFDRRFKRSRD